jgi:hypothetical protein
MLLNTIKEAAGSNLGRVALATRSYSPELYLAGGLLAGVASIIMLARAHKRSDEIIEPIIGEIAATKDWVREQNTIAVKESGHETVTRVEAQTLLKPLYGELVLDAVKIYGPGVVVGLGSVALILASHGVLRNRNRALISSVALLERGFSLYRKRVMQEFGKEVDENIYFGADSRTIVAIEEGKDGKTHKTKKERNYIPEVPTPMLYGRVFDSTIPRWNADRRRNETWLRMTQSMMNDKLNLYGVVFLNDVYAQLGFKKTAIGAVAGWCKDLPGGDDFIDFGLDNGINLNKGDNRWMLDFNVQGNILKGVGNDEAPELY